MIKNGNSSNFKYCKINMTYDFVLLPKTSNFRIVNYSFKHAGRFGEIFSNQIKILFLIKRINLFGV